MFEIDGFTAFLIGMLLSAGIFASYMISKRKENQKATINDYADQNDRLQEYEKISGWLVLVGISLILSLAAPLTYLGELTYIFEPELWAFFTDPTSEAYHSMFSYLIYFELFANLTLFVFSILLVILFFKKKSAFPQYFIVFIIVGLFVVITDAILADVVFSSYPVEWELNIPIDDNISSIGGVLLYAAVWIPYMVKSERVKRTFVH